MRATLHQSAVHLCSLQPIICTGYHDKPQTHGSFTQCYITRMCPNADCLCDAHWGPQGIVSRGDPCNSEVQWDAHVSPSTTSCKSVTVCECVCVLGLGGSLHEQQLLGSLSASARARNHGSSPRFQTLIVCACLCVCEWMSECVYTLRGRW